MEEPSDGGLQPALGVGGMPHTWTKPPGHRPSRGPGDGKVRLRDSLAVPGTPRSDGSWTALFSSKALWQALLRREAGSRKGRMLRERDRSLSLWRSRRLSQLIPPPRVQAPRCATGCRTGVSVTCSAARRPRRWVGWTTAQPSCSVCCARKSSFGRATFRKTTSRRRVARCIRFFLSVQK